MGFLDWIMKGIGFDSEEGEETPTENPRKPKIKKEKRKQQVIAKSIPDTTAFHDLTSAFASSTDEGVANIHHAEPTTFDNGLGSMGSSVGGFGSKTFVFFRPKNYEDVKSLVSYMKQGEPAIINLDDITEAEAQRILDFISGAVCALSGSIQRISGNIFLIAPEGYNIKLTSTR